jgi:hypothetical protein
LLYFSQTDIFQARGRGKNTKIEEKTRDGLIAFLVKFKGNVAVNYTKKTCWPRYRIIQPELILFLPAYLINSE